MNHGSLFTLRLFAAVEPVVRIRVQQTVRKRRIGSPDRDANEKLYAMENPEVSQCLVEIAFRHSGIEFPRPFHEAPGRLLRCIDKSVIEHPGRKEGQTGDRRTYPIPEPCTFPSRHRFILRHRSGERCGIAVHIQFVLPLIFRAELHITRGQCPRRVGPTGKELRRQLIDIFL